MASPDNSCIQFRQGLNNLPVSKINDQEFYHALKRASRNETKRNPSYLSLEFRVHIQQPKTQAGWT